MKAHPVWVCAVLGVSIALIVVACTIIQKQAPGVSIHEAYVEIYPGTKISSADRKALDAILEKFNKSLYQIRTYDRGKLVKTQGSLEDAQIDQILLAEADKASLKGGSYLTLQIGNPIKTHAIFWPHIAARPENELQDSERLRSRVAPILQKYSPQLALQSQTHG